MARLRRLASPAVRYRCVSASALEASTAIPGIPTDEDLTSLVSSELRGLYVMTSQFAHGTLMTTALSPKKLTALRAPLDMSWAIPINLACGLVGDGRSDRRLRGADELVDRQRPVLHHQAPRARSATGRVRGQPRRTGLPVDRLHPVSPQTCGKIERLWQTLKKWLRAREATHGPHPTLASLNRELQAFAEHYNTRRPHRAHHGRTPAAVFAATVKARPAQRPLPAQTQIYRTHASTGGTVVVGPYAVFVGGRSKGLPVTAIRDGNFIAIFTGTKLIRALDADPTKRYQPLGRAKRTTH
jgi:hypothetical protein